jgi:hypothetical protein
MGEREVLRDGVLAQSLHWIDLGQLEFLVIPGTNSFELMDDAIFQDCLSQQHLRVGPIFNSLRVLCEEREFWIRPFDDLVMVDIAECFKVIVILSDLQSFLRVDHEDSLLVQPLQYQSFDEVRPQ